MRKRSGQVHSRESSATLQLTVSLLYQTDNQCLKKKENNAMIERALLRKDYAYKEKETLSSKE